MSVLLCFFRRELFLQLLFFLNDLQAHLFQRLFLRFACAGQCELFALLARVERGDLFLKPLPFRIDVRRQLAAEFLPLVVPALPQFGECRFLREASFLIKCLLPFGQFRFAVNCHPLNIAPLRLQLHQLARLTLFPLLDLGMKVDLQLPNLLRRRSRFASSSSSCFLFLGLKL